MWVIAENGGLYNLNDFRSVGTLPEGKKFVVVAYRDFDEDESDKHLRLSGPVEKKESVKLLNGLARHLKAKSLPDLAKPVKVGAF